MELNKPTLCVCVCVEVLLEAAWFLLVPFSFLDHSFKSRHTSKNRCCPVRNRFFFALLSAQAHQQREACLSTGRLVSLSQRGRLSPPLGWP